MEVACIEDTQNVAFKLSLFKFYDVYSFMDIRGEHRYRVPTFGTGTKVRLSSFVTGQSASASRRGLLAGHQLVAGSSGIQLFPPPSLGRIS
ncbi:unnamed protein product [Lactuca virosa]|uniref:Uncharacterized protein n=1 Tax=Lactuca virosa TaxID=75947 RepID=A0AAU9MGQ2_9ASTR|nr:unnamed protein product [Lactuca virosa]